MPSSPNRFDQPSQPSRQSSRRNLGPRPDQRPLPHQRPRQNPGQGDGQNTLVTVLGFVGVAVLVVLSVLLVRFITGQQNMPAPKQPATQTQPANNTATNQGQAHVDDWEPASEAPVEEYEYEYEILE